MISLIGTLHPREDRGEEPPCTDHPHFSFLLSSFGGITRLVIYRCTVCLFPAILVVQVLVGAMGNTPPIWVHGVGDISDVILSFWFLYIKLRVGPDRDFAPPRKDYTPFVSSFRFVVAFPRG